MYRLAICNQKGGSGKTTTAVNLAACLGEKGQRVLLIDLDPQASATQWMGVEEEDRGLLDVLANNGNLADLVRNTEVTGVDFISSSSWLVGAERALAGEVGAETILGQAIEALPRDRWDLVLIDCPPSLGLLAVSALAACNGVLVPVESRVMAVAGLVALLRTIDRVQQRLNSSLEILGILPCRVDLRTNLSREVVKRLRGRFSDLVMKGYIRENVRLAEAPSFGEPIVTYDSRSAGSQDYRAVAAELIKRVQHRSVTRKAA